MASTWPALKLYSGLLLFRVCAVGFSRHLCFSFFRKVSHFGMIFCSLRCSLSSCCRQPVGWRRSAPQIEIDLLCLRLCSHLGRNHLALHRDGRCDRHRGRHRGRHHRERHRGLSFDGRLGFEAVGAAEGVEEACQYIRSSTYTSIEWNRVSCAPHIEECAPPREVRVVCMGACLRWSGIALLLTC